MRFQGWGKWVGLAAVLLLLTACLAQVSALVAERQSQRSAAAQGVAQSLAGAQTLVGPLAQQACFEEWPVASADGKPTTARRDFVRTAMPAALGIEGATRLEARSRGLHATQVFHLKGTLQAQWNDLAAFKAERSRADARLECGPIRLIVGVSDARGLRHIELQANGAALPVQAGTTLEGYPRGAHAELPATLDLRAPLSVRLNLDLVGTERLGFVPLGTATQARLTSDWPHPSYDGQFLPLQHQTGASGFDAQWRVSALASTAQQDLLRKRSPCGAQAVATAGGGAQEAGCLETLGVSFIDPTNTYALSDRATKYGMLFVLLTFVAVGLFEFLRALRVHPIQYFLVGAAISIFFLLLVSLSEHLAFGAAYAAAASACVLLLGYYASHMLRSWKRGLPFGAGIATLYGLLYLLLQLEQKALVVGAVALFLVLAFVMLLTRKVDWYAQLQNPARNVA